MEEEKMKTKEKYIMNNKFIDNWDIPESYQRLWAEGELQKAITCKCGKYHQKRTLYKAIVDAMNKAIARELAKGNKISLPYRMGTLKIAESHLEYIKKNGRIVTNRGINWKATKELWQEDEEAMSERFMIYYDAETMYHLYWDKADGGKHKTFIFWKNRPFFTFHSSKPLRKAIALNGLAGNLESHMTISSIKGHRYKNTYYPQR